jgi:hypothetical protein
MKRGRLDKSRAGTRADDSNLSPGPGRLETCDKGGVRGREINVERARRDRSLVRVVVKSPTGLQSLVILVEDVIEPADVRERKDTIWRDKEPSRGVVEDGHREDSAFPSSLERLKPPLGEEDRHEYAEGRQDRERRDKRYDGLLCVCVSGGRRELCGDGQ